jgi:hypothetical protein
VEVHRATLKTLEIQKSMKLFHPDLFFSVFTHSSFTILAPSTSFGLTGTADGFL